MDVVTYNTLITALCKEGRVEDAVGLVAEMKLKKLGPDQYTHYAIFGSLKDEGRMKQAEDLISEVIEMGKLTDQPLQMDKGRDIVTCKTPGESDSSSIAHSERINDLCTEGRYNDAMRTFVELTDKGISLNKTTYISLMNGLIKRKISTLRAG